MFRRNLWKITLSLFIALWAVVELMPYKDVPFADYAKSQATVKTAEFSQLLKEAHERVTAGKAISDFAGLKQIGMERKIDFSQYFPDIKLEASLKNVKRRDDILLDELLKRSKRKLQLGLDLKGGVAFTLEVDEKAAAAADRQDVRQEKLAKAVEIIGNRINSLGVSEPLIRIVDNNRIEVQLAGVSTRNNPEVVDSLKKPARLEFRLVHPFLTPGTSTEVPPGYEVMGLDEETRGGE